jgi:hypothetical protein
VGQTTRCGWTPESRSAKLPSLFFFFLFFNKFCSFKCVFFSFLKDMKCLGERRVLRDTLGCFTTCVRAHQGRLSDRCSLRMLSRSSRLRSKTWIMPRASPSLQPPHGLRRPLFQRLAASRLRKTAPWTVRSLFCFLQTTWSISEGGGFFFSALYFVSSKSHSKTAGIPSIVCSSFQLHIACFLGLLLLAALFVWPRVDLTCHLLTFCTS